MTIAEIFPIEIELRRSCATRVVTPAIRKQNAADVEKMVVIISRVFDEF